MNPMDFVRAYSDFYSKLEGRGPDLQGADLSGLYLFGINFRFANLRGANLSNCVLIGADFCGANLEGADLSHANLEWAQFGLGLFPSSKPGGCVVFEKANLQHADLSRANLRYAQLKDSVLDFADLRGADLSFADVDELPTNVLRDSLTVFGNSEKSSLG